MIEMHLKMTQKQAINLKRDALVEADAGLKKVISIWASKLNNSSNNVEFFAHAKLRLSNFDLHTYCPKK